METGYRTVEAATPAGLVERLRQTLEELVEEAGEGATAVRYESGKLGAEGSPARFSLTIAYVREPTEASE